MENLKKYLLTNDFFFPNTGNKNNYLKEAKKADLIDCSFVDHSFLSDSVVIGVGFEFQSLPFPILRSL